MKVFFSSVYQDGRTPSEERHLAIRRELWTEGRARGHDMWIAEYSHPEMTGDTPWRNVIDACTHGVVDCDLVIALFFRRWGSPITIDSLGESATSFFEIELFHASLKRLPVYFLQADDFRPEPELNRLMELLRGLTSSRQWISAPERELKGLALDLIDMSAVDRSRSLAGLTDRLSDERSFRDIRKELDSTRLSFVGRFGPVSGPEAYSLERSVSLIGEAKQIGETTPLNYVDSLSRLWIAMREMSRVPPAALGPEDLAAWFDLAELWASPAAWLRLHGPLALGVLAALQTRTAISSKLHPTEQPPFGAFASEAYSIGKVSHSRRWRTRRFKASRLLATRQADNATDPSGAWLIRASATMELAQLGRPWLLWPAHRDYVEAVRFRERHQSSRSALGEAQVELAYADFAIGRTLFWRRANALRLMREGVANLEADHPDRRPGFVRRAKEKLASALEQDKQMEEAAAQRSQIKDFARAHGLPSDG